MKFESERKFLIKKNEWPKPERGIAIRQGYLSSDKHHTVRIRVAGRRGLITIKGPVQDKGRPEFEYEIPYADAGYLLDNLCRHPLIEKTRYLVRHGEFTWEVDVFEGENEGLIIAEVEVDDPAAKPDLPDWVGKEVTGDPRYYNASLTDHPYTRW